MSTKRKIEVFTAGCPLCNETLELVKNAVTDCGCVVIERRCSDDEQCDEAKQYGVKAMPTVVVDGRVMFEGRISREQAATLTLAAA
ncbi:MAG: thioredoxin family protein [Chthoniobacterales bacterium]|nr:MAG: thioredoxin family protein [Chthoniobacterales bacterium]